LTVLKPKLVNITSDKHQHRRVFKLIVFINIALELEIYVIYIKLPHILQTDSVICQIISSYNYDSLSLYSLVSRFELSTSYT